MPELYPNKNQKLTHTTNLAIDRFRYKDCPLTHAAAFGRSSQLRSHKKAAHDNRGGFVILTEKGKLI